MNAQEFAEEESFKLMTTFPKKIFTAEDYDKPLDLLGVFIAFIITQSVVVSQTLTNFKKGGYFFIFIT